VIVVVGAVSMNIPREPHFYRKELELKISCSYGPGRYDPSYEECGSDYPYGYVRWTENRNMAAFVKLLENHAVDVKPLITHVFDIEEAQRAYDLVTGKDQERHIAILLKYPQAPVAHTAPSASPAPLPPSNSVGIGFIGAGSFAQKFLIPYATRGGRLITVVTSRGVTATSVAKKFGFRSCTTDVRELLSNPAINAVFIATRHDTHAGFAAAALEAGKHVFVEKPLAIREDEFARVVQTARAHPDCRLMVGFNRRFSPIARQARNVFSHVAGPLVIVYRVNAGFVPRDHWTQSEQGGGRILGEVCHFVDLLQFLTDSAPTSVFAQCISGGNAKMPDHDNVAITIRFANGSVGQISYLACGDNALAKERIEIFGGGQSFVIDDFRVGEHYTGGKCRRLKMPGKGHQEEVQAFIEAIHAGLPSPITLDSLALTTVTTFAILDSLHTGLAQEVPMHPAFPALTANSQQRS
jgi:predicted dehydrogenase